MIYFRSIRFSAWDAICSISCFKYRLTYHRLLRPPLPQRKHKILIYVDLYDIYISPPTAKVEYLVIWFINITPFLFYSCSSPDTCFRQLSLFSPHTYKVFSLSRRRGRYFAFHACSSLLSIVDDLFDSAIISFYAWYMPRCHRFQMPTGAIYLSTASRSFYLLTPFLSATILCRAALQKCHKLHTIALSLRFIPTGTTLITGIKI